MENKQSLKKSAKKGLHPLAHSCYNQDKLMKAGTYKHLPYKKLPKSDREKALLFGLIELYLKTGKPIGSQTMQDHGFKSLSSATIRNYFSKLETLGFLKQPHTSGGRIPTEQAYRLYADTYKNEPSLLDRTVQETIQRCFTQDSQEVAALLHQAAEILSDLTGCAAFLSAPRFDQDFVQEIKLLELTPMKLLSIVITNFGLIRTETIYLDRSINPSFLQTCEEYFQWRLNQRDKPLFANEAEAKMAQRIYNEVMVRYVVGHSNFSNEDIIRTGLSKLLNYPEFTDATALASSLCLLEDEEIMRSLLRETIQNNELTYWIGNDLCPNVPEDSECTIVAIPYYIHNVPAGSIAFLGPMRIPYKNLFGILQLLSEKVSDVLTDSLYKFKISVRQPTNRDNQIERKPPTGLL